MVAVAFPEPLTKEQVNVLGLQLVYFKCYSAANVPAVTLPFVLTPMTLNTYPGWTFTQFNAVIVYALKGVHGTVGNTLVNDTFPVFRECDIILKSDMLAAVNVAKAWVAEFKAIEAGQR